MLKLNRMTLENAKLHTIACINIHNIAHECLVSYQKKEKELAHADVFEPNKVYALYQSYREERDYDTETWIQMQSALRQLKKIDVNAYNEVESMFDNK